MSYTSKWNTHTHVRSPSYVSPNFVHTYSYKILVHRSETKYIEAIPPSALAGGQEVAWARGGNSV